MSALEKIISRLDEVSQKGEQFKASCPAHDDSNPSLSIKQIDDRILLKCWAGCSAVDVVHAIGLELSDLFDEPLHHQSPLPSYKRNHSRPLPAADILRAISLELTVTCIAAEKMTGGEPLNDEEIARLYLAYQRVNKAIDAGGIR